MASHLCIWPIRPSYSFFTITPRPIHFSMMSTLTWVSDPRISLMLKCFLFITYECVYVSTPYIMFHRVLSRSRHDTIDWDFIIIRIIEYFVVCKATLYDTCTLGPAGLISLSSMVSLSWTRIYHYEHLNFSIRGSLYMEHSGLSCIDFYSNLIMSLLGHLYSGAKLVWLSHSFGSVWLSFFLCLWTSSTYISGPRIFAKTWMVKTIPLSLSIYQLIAFSMMLDSRIHLVCNPCTLATIWSPLFGSWSHWIRGRKIMFSYPTYIPDFHLILRWGIPS